MHWPALPLTPALLEHHGHKGLAVVEHRAQVHLHDEVPVLGLHAQQQVVAGDAGVVDQGVEAAVFFLHLLGDGHGLVVVGGVAGYEAALGAHFAQLGEELGAGLVLLKVGENHCGTLFCEGEGGAATDTARAAGHQCYLVF